MIGEIEALLDEALTSTGRCSPDPSRECSSMFLTMASARLPCCTILSRLSRNVFVSSAISPRVLVIEVYGAESLLQFIDQLHRDTREIVDEIERVFDLVRDTGGELAERG